VIAKFVFMLSEDNNRKVVSQTITSLNDLINALGPAAIDHSINTITEAVIQLLSKNGGDES
jgi:hypothetical protein